jgi:hypothetical protein
MRSMYSGTFLVHLRPELGVIVIADRGVCDRGWLDRGCDRGWLDLGWRSNESLAWLGQSGK